MNTSRTAALALAAALLSAGMAFAQTVVTDTDGNGTWSIEEMRATYPDLADGDFAALDVDGNAQIDADELQAGRESGLIAP
ncbi:MAG: EF-hand domain-containing protein [Paracoccaceae bacterium]